MVLREVGGRLVRSTGLLRPVWGDVTRLDLIRRRQADRLVRVATAVHDYLEFVGLEHLPAHRSVPRWGHGRPLHPQLTEIIAAHRPSYDAIVGQAIDLVPDLLRIPVHPSDDIEPAWSNSWVPGIDTVLLYTLLRTRRPARYVEVGSGFSTRVVARAVRDGGLNTRITSIDPAPRAAIDRLCDDVVRRPAEDVAADTWAALNSGDILFVDNSHRALMHSDVTVFFLEVLPALADGVIVGVHDVLLPADYFPSWAGYLFSEQYLLAAYLLAGSPLVTPLFPAYWASEIERLTASLDAPLWGQLPAAIDRRGWSFWFTVHQPHR